MALDASLGLRDVPPGPARATAQRNDRPWYEAAEARRGATWAVRSDGDWFSTADGVRIPAGDLARLCVTCIGRRWLILAPEAGSALPGALDRLARDGGNAYELLERLGVLIAGDTERGRLAGGSYSETALRQVNGRLCVRKSISIRGGPDAIDADGKLMREEEALRQGAGAADELFPAVLGAERTPTGFSYDSAFVFGYSLGELVFQNRIGTERVIALLESTFDRLLRGLYGRPAMRTDRSCQEPGILDRVLRRLEAIAASNDPIAQDWKPLLQRERLTVNGRTIDGWPPIRAWLAGDPLVAEALFDGTAERCHGDLIFDDMVAPAHGRVLTLIDPNGDAESRLYDVCKVHLSTWSFYEAFKFDLFECGGDASDICIRLRAERALSTLEAINQDLPALLRRVGVWTAGHPEPDGPSLLLRNGLHNLGLPMFHLLHHRAPSRALAFFALGLVRLNEARQILGSAQRPRAEDVIATHSLLHRLVESN